MGMKKDTRVQIMVDPLLYGALRRFAVKRFEGNVSMAIRHLVFGGLVVERQRIEEEMRREPLPFDDAPLTDEE